MDNNESYQTNANNTNTNTNNNNNKNVKDELIANIKDWIVIDNDIVKIKNDMKDKVKRKKELTERLVTVMKKNAIDCFDINGGSLIYKQRKTKKTITGKYLLSQLEEYYKDKPEIAQEITKKVLENREEIIKDEIKRK